LFLVQLTEALETSMGQGPDTPFEDDIEDATKTSETVVVIGQQTRVGAGLHRLSESTKKGGSVTSMVG
jgi:hypothetical protein